MKLAGESQGTRAAQPTHEDMDISSAADGREAKKKRKVRKGTQSCWECKRRKSKCSFSNSGTGSVCDSCTRRGTRCIGQEYAEDPASTRQQLGDRLGRVERLLASRRGAGTDSDTDQSFLVQENDQTNPTGSPPTSRDLATNSVKVRFPFYDRAILTDKLEAVFPICL